MQGSTMVLFLSGINGSVTRLWHEFKSAAAPWSGTQTMLEKLKQTEILIILILTPACLLLIGDFFYSPKLKSKIMQMIWKESLRNACLIRISHASHISQGWDFSRRDAFIGELPAFRGSWSKADRDTGLLHESKGRWTRLNTSSPSSPPFSSLNNPPTTFNMMKNEMTWKNNIKTSRKSDLCSSFTLEEVV